MAQKRDFDQAAARWDEEPRRIALAREVAAAILETVRPDRETEALDFGCGTGLLTLELQPYLKRVTGLDSSRGMLGVLERKIQEKGLGNVTTLFWDFEKGGRPEGRYHLVTSSMTLHHVPELPPLFRLLYDLLRPGGRIALADLDREDGTFHDDPVGVHHYGFERNRLQEDLAGCGFVDIGHRIISRIVKERGEYPVFLLTARRPAE